ncbi:MAG: GGDEF domain-containing protein [Patescibacteria group bacterium]
MKFLKKYLTFLWGFIKTVRDRTERAFEHESNKFHAYHDVLTGLPNRASLERQAGIHFHERAPSHQLALLFVDLTNLKRSMIASAITRETCFCKRSPGGFAPRRGKKILWRASVVMNSWCLPKSLHRKTPSWSPRIFLNRFRRM